MGDNALIFQILVGIAVLFFGFLTYMNTKTWRWPHVTMMFMVFAAALTFIAYAGLTLKTRTTWLKLVGELHKSVDQQTAANDLLQRGPDSEAVAKTPSVVSVTHELQKVVLDRGRVWRQASPIINADRSVTLSMQPAAAAPAADPLDPTAAAAAAPAPTKHNIAVKAVVYAFKEGDDAAGIKVPRFYLGEFQVVAATDNSIQVTPTRPLAPDQAAEAARADSTWAIYETAPIDSHALFEDITQEELAALIPQAATGLDAEKYQALLQQYLRDGKPAQDTDSPDNVRVEVKFLKPYEVVVDAAEVVAAPDAAPFDSEGQAQLGRLRRGEPVKFAVGDVGVFDRAAADELVEQGIAGEPKAIYRRKLNDYEFGFINVYRQLLAFDQRIKDTTRDIATIKAATEQAEGQITIETDRVEKLTADLAKVKYERDELTTYVAKLDGRVKKVQGELSRLYAENRARSKELTEISEKLLQDADRRARAATAMVQ